MDKIQDKLFGSLTPEQSLGLFILIMMLFFGGMTSRIIYAIIVNEKNFKKFRSNLKIGDITDKGTVTKIDGAEITIETIINKNSIYPKSQGKQIYRYKND